MGWTLPHWAGRWVLHLKRLAPSRPTGAAANGWAQAAATPCERQYEEQMPCGFRPMRPITAARACSLHPWMDAQMQPRCTSRSSQLGIVRLYECAWARSLTRYLYGWCETNCNRHKETRQWERRRPALGQGGRHGHVPPEPTTCATRYLTTRPSTLHDPNQ
jgi:hypothetical protein